MRQKSTILMLSALFMISANASDQAQKKLPALVQNELSEMLKTCSEVGGKPGKSPGLLTVADLTGDSVPDFIIDESAFNCEGAASLYSGSGGSQVYVYVGTSDGQAIEAFSNGNFGVIVDRKSKPAKLLLIVGGPLCGQKVTPQTSKVEMKQCLRPVVWDGQTRKLEFAPLSQIQPVQ